MLILRTQVLVEEFIYKLWHLNMYSS